MKQSSTTPINITESKYRHMLRRLALAIDGVNSLDSDEVLAEVNAYEEALITEGRARVALKLNY